MNPKQFEYSGVSCNCFPGPYQTPSKPAFITSNKNAEHFTSVWEQKILKKLAKEQSQQQYVDVSILSKSKKKSLRREIDRSTLQASKKLPEFKTIELVEPLDSSKRFNQISKIDSDRQRHNKKTNNLLIPQHQHFPMNHILTLSKHQNPRMNEIPKYNHLQSISGHNRMNSMSENFNNLTPQTANSYNVKFIRNSLQQQPHSMANKGNFPINKNADRKPQIVKKVTQQNQWQMNLLSPNSARRSPRKSTKREGPKQFKNQTLRQSVGQSPIEIKSLSNGSPDPKASKKYSLTQSTANKTLMKPKQIESVLDSDQEDKFSEVVMDMNRIEDFSQIERISTHEALKNFFMKGTMMGTNATESCNLSNKHVQ